VDVDDIAFSCSLFSDKVDNTDGLNQLQIDAFGCMVQGSFLTYMYSVGRHSRSRAVWHGFKNLGFLGFLKKNLKNLKSPNLGFLGFFYKIKNLMFDLSC